MSSPVSRVTYTGHKQSGQVHWAILSCPLETIVRLLQYSHTQCWNNACYSFARAFCTIKGRGIISNCLKFLPPPAKTMENTTKLYPVSMEGAALQHNTESDCTVLEIFIKLRPECFIIHVTRDVHQTQGSYCLLQSMKNITQTVV